MFFIGNYYQNTYYNKFVTKRTKYNPWDKFSDGNNNERINIRQKFIFIRMQKITNS